MNIKSIVDFILKEGEGLYNESHRVELTKAIEGHIKYGSLITLFDPEGIYALARLNFEEDTPFIIDTIVRKDRRCIKTIKDLIRQGRSQFPRATFILFNRCKKYHNGKYHNIDITKVKGQQCI